MSNFRIAKSIARVIFSFALLAACWLPASVSIGDTFEWTGGAGTSNWNDAGNWSNTSPFATDADGIPDLDDTARFTADAMAAGGSAENLTVLTGVNLEIGNGGSTSSVTVGGTITNSGEIGFQADTADNTGGNSPDQAIVINSTVTLEGGGTIRFTDPESGIRTDNNAGVLTNVDNTIRGAGSIGNTFSNLSINNQGTIIAEGGTLSLTRTALDNTDGLINIASNGILNGSQSTISGGILDGDIGARFTGNTLADLETTGVIAIGGGSTSTATFEGTITNNGEIGFQADAADNTGGNSPDQAIVINSAVSLEGGGTIRFTDSESGIRTDNTGVLTNVDNTIRGAGSIGNTFSNLSINNQGTIIAEGGTLSLTRTALDNTDGLINIASNGILNGSQSTISGGILDGDIGARFTGNTLADLETTGVIAIGGGSTSTATFEGTITNNGEIGFQADAADNTGGNSPDQAIVINSAVSLEGGGTIRFTDSESGIRTDNTGVLTNVDNTIRGAGSIGTTFSTLSINNQGTIVAEGGTLSLTRTALDNTDGLVNVLLDGTDFSNSGSLDFSGSVDLNGTLGLVVGALLDAEAGDTFRVLEATSLGGSQFDSINFEAAGAFDFDVIYGADFVDVEVLSVDPGPFNIFGDFDLDGDVDADDIDFYSGNVDFEFAQGEFAQLNQNSDGLITLADHNTHIFTLAETSNGQIGTFLGDFNLDGRVDVLEDAFTLVGNLGSENAGFADGDVNADGRVDVLVDAFALVTNLGNSNLDNLNFGNSSFNISSTSSSFVSTSAIPEPGILPLLIFAAVGTASQRRKTA